MNFQLLEKKIIKKANKGIKILKHNIENRTALENCNLKQLGFCFKIYQVKF